MKSKLRVREIGSNQIELNIEGAAHILFSYGVPVAGKDVEFWKTNEHHSTTTSKHVSSWLRDHGQEPKKVKTIDPEAISELLTVTVGM